jgi:hypothetical protein
MPDFGPKLGFGTVTQKLPNVSYLESSPLSSAAFATKKIVHSKNLLKQTKNHKIRFLIKCISSLPSAGHGRVVAFAAPVGHCFPVRVILLVCQRSVAFTTESVTRFCLTVYLHNPSVIIEFCIARHARRVVRHDKKSGSMLCLVVCRISYTTLSVRLLIDFKTFAHSDVGWARTFRVWVGLGF